MASRRVDNDMLEDSREAARRRLARRQAARAGASSGEERDGDRETGFSRAGRARRSPARSARSASSGSSPLRSDGHSSDVRVIHIPRAVIIVAGVFLLVALFAGIGAIERSCSRQDEPEPIGVEQVEQEPEPAPAPEQADFSLLPADLSDEDADALKAQASDSRIVYIVNNRQRYVDAFGEERATKLLQLVAQEPESLDFVAALLDSYPQSSAKPYEEKVSKGTVPLLMQWDERWGYTEYCAGPFGSTGCCPTSLSMVYMGLTGKTDKTPADMAVLATENGYAADGEGTIGSFLTDMAPSLGLQCELFTPSSDALLTYLESGYAVIVNVGPGDFTTAGHFFVATGVASDGSIRINDPYSKTNSSVTWDADRLTNQSIAMYALKAQS